MIEAVRPSESFNLIIAIYPERTHKYNPNAPAKSRFLNPPLLCRLFGSVLSIIIRVRPVLRCSPSLPCAPAATHILGSCCKVDPSPRLFSPSILRTECGRTHKQKSPPSPPLYILLQIRLPVFLSSTSYTQKDTSRMPPPFFCMQILSHGSVVCGSLLSGGKLPKIGVGVQASIGKKKLSVG